MEEIKKLFELEKQILLLRKKYKRQRLVVGKAIQKRRIDRGYSYREAAKVLHISPAYLSDIEKGNRGFPTNRKTKRWEVLNSL